MTIINQPITYGMLQIREHDSIFPVGLLAKIFCYE